MEQNSNRMMWLIVGGLLTGIVFTGVITQWDKIMQLISLLFIQKAPLF